MPSSHESAFAEADTKPIKEKNETALSDRVLLALASEHKKPEAPHDLPQHVLHHLATGKINLRQCEEAAESFQLSNDEVARAVERMSDRGRQFVSILINNNFHKPYAITTEEAAAFILHYPLAFLEDHRPEKINKIFDAVERKSGPDARLSYEESWEHFVDNLYGKRYEAWKMILNLREQARVLPLEKSEREIALSAPVPLVPLTPKQSEDLLKKSEIHGDPIKGKKLTKALLKKEKMSPVMEIRTDDVRYGFSRPFLYRGKRPAVIAYVETRDEETGEWQYNIRAFYQSRSQGMWRYLPDRELSGQQIAWFGKGHGFGGEESINLPAMVQEALSAFVRDTDLPSIKNEDVLLAGTARETDHAVRYGIEVADASFYGDVSATPVTLQGNLQQHQDDYSGRRTSIAPEQLVLEEIGEEPRLSHGPLRQWQAQTKLYGKITCETFLSNNEQLLYLFCCDQHGRAWIGGVEHVASRIVSNGVRARWVNSGNLGTPAFEYDSQDKGYGGRTCPQDHHYVDMFPDYLSKIPLIKRYVEHVKSRKKSVKGGRAVKSKRQAGSRIESST